MAGNGASRSFPCVPVKVLTEPTTAVQPWGVGTALRAPNRTPLSLPRDISNREIGTVLPLPSPTRPSGGEQDRAQQRFDRLTAKPGRNCCRRCLRDLIKPVRHLRVDRGADGPAVALADGGFAR